MVAITRNPPSLQRVPQQRRYFFHSYKAGDSEVVLYYYRLPFGFYRFVRNDKELYWIREVHEAENKRWKQLRRLFRG